MLSEFLEKAAEMGCDTIKIEYDEGKEWITAFNGPLGVGIGCMKTREAEPLFKEIRDLKRQKRVTVAGATYQVTVSEYDSFGEVAYRIKLKKATRTTASSKRRTRT